MTTTTSSSEKGRFLALYRNTLRRHAGYFGLISVLIAIFYPIQYAMEAFRKFEPWQLEAAANVRDPYYYDFFGIGRNFTGVSAVMFTLIMLVAPLVLSLVLNSYMQSKKAADVYHALPVRREMLLLVNTAVAMTIIGLPVLLSNLAVIIMQTARFGLFPQLIGAALFDMFGWLVTAFFIYLLTAFVSVLSGTVFDSFVFSSALMVSVTALMGLYVALASIFLYGFQVSEDFLVNLLNFSPLTLMPARFAFSGSIPAEAVFSAFSVASAAGSVGIIGGADGPTAIYTTARYAPEYIDDDMWRMLVHSNWAVPAYLLLAVALLFVTMRLYKRRRSEMAETTTSRGILQLIIKLLGTAICGICTGFLFSMILNFEDDIRAPFLIWTLIGGALGNVIIEVILNRGFKTLLKSLPVGGLMVLAVAGSCAGLMFGGFGYEDRVPSAQDVASVEISYMGRYGGPSVFSATEGGMGGFRRRYINSVYLSDPAAVAAVADYHRDVVDIKFERNDTELQDAGHHPAWVSTEIVYRLQNGGRISRVYRMVDTASLVKLAPLEVSPEFLTQTHPAFFTAPEDVTLWEVSDPFGSKKETPVLGTDGSAALLEAMRDDLSAQTLDGLMSGEGGYLAAVRFEMRVPPQGSARCAEYGTFLVTERTPETLAFLRERGILQKVAADFSKCEGVMTEVLNGRMNWRYSNNTGGVYQTDFERDYSEYDTIAHAREEIERRELYHKEMLEGYGETAAEYSDDLRLYEDPEVVAELAKRIVATYRADEPIVMLRFYFEGARGGRMVAAPLKSLPEDLQLELDPHGLG